VYEELFMVDNQPEPKERKENSPKAFLKSRRRTILGAIFLMATSAIGPGFITQTATFTFQMGAAFGFAILVSVVVDFAVQLNVWRIVTVAGKRAGQLANEAIPGLGHVLGMLIVLGGLAFNIGNIAGGGLGMNAMLGIDPQWGGVLTGVLAIAIFLWRRAGRVVDVVVMVLGVGMIVLTLYVAIVSSPPVGEALRQTVLPDEINFATITTIIGGTVGGYITYAGAHRYLDSGLIGPENVQQVHRASTNGIIVVSVMRFILFLAILGVAASGLTVDLADPEVNPAGAAFMHVLGNAGFRIFGIIFWAAALSSVIGSAYTSATFLSVFSRKLHDGLPLRIATVAFIVVSLVLYVLWGAAPAAILVFVGGLNGLILPIGLTIFMFIGWFRQQDLLHGYRYPKGLLIFGTAATVLSWYMAIVSVVPIYEMISG